MKIKTGLGQDSHAFETAGKKPLILGAVHFDYSLDCPHGLRGNSDSDVILHALTNAISSVTGNNILGKTADQLCANGERDSRAYLALALQDLGDWKIEHIAISVECLVPKITPKMAQIKANIARLTHTNISDIGITATTGEGLTAAGRGEGIAVLCIITLSQS